MSYLDGIAWHPSQEFHLRLPTYLRRKFAIYDCNNRPSFELVHVVAAPAGAPPPPVPVAEVVNESLLVLEEEGYGEGWAVPAADEESSVLRGEFENLWPLQLVDLRDDEMVGTLFRLLRRLPQVTAQVASFCA